MINFLRNILAFTRPRILWQLEEQLKGVSITGRMAYCITCLENALASEQLHGPELENLLVCLWEFTSSTDLGNWEERIMDFLPETIFNNSQRQPAFLTIEAVKQLKKIYLILSPGLLQCIDDVVEVARGNLYAGTVGHSQNTLTPTMAAVRYMVAKGYALPATNNFLRSPFSEQDSHGWGKRVDRRFFQ